MKVINKYVTWRYADDWRDIGLQLHLDDRKLCKIDIKHQCNEAKFCCMITYWIKKECGDATWKALEVALTNVNRQKLGLDPVYDVYGMIIYLLYTYNIYLYITLSQLRSKGVSVV